MNKVKTYCIVARNRATNKREMITGEITGKESAVREKQRINASGSWRKTHKFFHVARYPFKTK